MPLTAKGERIMAAFQEQYGERAEEMFYKAKNAGTITGVDSMPIGVVDLLYYDPITGSQDPRNKRYGGSRKVTQRDPMGRLISEFEEEDAMPLFRVIGDAAPVGAATVNLVDAVDLDDAAKVSYTEDGVMKAMPRIARTGIQTYAGEECGIADREWVKVYRPADSVFHKDAWKTYTHIPVTLDHPPVPVTTDNWKKFAVGETGEDVLRDQEAVRVPMMLRDAAAIAAFKAGTNQLSVGYTCDLEWSPGVTERGETYDAIQRNIRANHLAVVAAARGGPSLTIGDDKKQESTMNLKTVMVDGIECQMTDTAAALVARTIQTLRDQIENLEKKKKDDDDCKKDSAVKITELTTASATKDAEIVTLKKQLADAKLTPQALDALVKDRHAVVDKARKVLGDKLVVDGKTIEDMRKQVVDAKLGAAAQGWTDEQIKASFDTLVAGSGGSTVNDAVRVFAGRTSPGWAQPQQSAPVFDSSNPQHIRDAAYAMSVFDMETAWMNPEQRKAAAAARGIQL
jgi:hypothetical protein